MSTLASVMFEVKRIQQNVENYVQLSPMIGQFLSLFGYASTYICLLLKNCQWMLNAMVVDKTFSMEEWDREKEEEEVQDGGRYKYKLVTLTWECIEERARSVMRTRSVRRARENSRKGTWIEREVTTW